jgi:cyclic-di-AMP phosphodiesterase PgpH
MPKKKKDLPHLRENYEDHSLKFLDWVHDSGLQRTRFFRILSILDDRYHLRRFFWVLVFSFTLAFVINYDLDISTDYKIGDAVQKDIISPISFEMVDDVTTEEKRLKAEASVPLIFDFDPTVFERVSGHIYRSFRLMRNELKVIKWPRSQMMREEVIKEFFSHKSQFETELGVQVSDYLFEWLTQQRFSARVENSVIFLLGDWYQFKLVEGLDKNVPTSKSIVVARTLQRGTAGREFSISRNDLLDVANIEAFVLAPSKKLDAMSSQDRANLLSFSRLLIYPNLTLNKGEMSFRKDLARNQVLPITMSLKRNQNIIEEGTIVQPSHMAILNRISELQSKHRKDLTMLAMALLFLSMILVFFQYIRRFTVGKMKIESKDLIVMALVTLSGVITTKIFWFTAETAIVSKFGSLVPAYLFLFAAPVAAGPMLIGLVIQSGEIVWLFSAFSAIVMGLMSESNFAFMLVTFAGGIAGARGVFACKKRSDIYLAGLRTGLVNAILIALLLLITRVNQDSIWKELIAGVPAGFLGGIFSAMVAMMIIPFIESVFNYTTDVKLLELSNLNHPLLKEMIVKAPGTYHHSMMVGSMVEAAAEEIGANPLLGKVMCYYHDIGKMEHANYFIENQKVGHNPHDHISPYMSKTLLVAHVKDGVELGIKYALGKPIIDGVIQHHGTTLISYFYNKAIDLKSDDDVDVQEEEFRYPGPKPQFREAALCMLADSIEAAARSLDEPTPVRLQNIVRNIIQRKFMDGQLDECNLTLKDLSKVEAAFSRILMGIYHQRIDYPRSAGGGASEAEVTSLFSSSKKA